MAKTVVGLEITEEGVRAVEVAGGKTPAIVAFGSVPLPRGAAKDSEVFDKDAVALALRQLWSRSGIKGKHVVLGIGSRRILVREYTTIALRPDLLKQALPFQVQDLLPVPADQAVLDFHPTSHEGNQVTGLLVAAVAETVEELLATTAKAKIRVDVVDLAPFGLARAVSRAGVADETIAAFHLGDHTSYVVVVQNGVPQFVRIIPMELRTEAVRGRELADIGDGTEADAAQAVEALDTVPPSTDAPMRRMRSGSRAVARPAGMSESAIVDIVGRLGGTLRFYSDRSADRPVTRVLLSGAGALVPGVADSLAASLPIPVEHIGVGRIASGKVMPHGDDDLNLLATVGIALGEGR